MLGVIFVIFTYRFWGKFACEAPTSFKDHVPVSVWLFGGNYDDLESARAAGGTLEYDEDFAAMADMGGGESVVAGKIVPGLERYMKRNVLTIHKLWLKLQHESETSDHALSDVHEFMRALRKAGMHQISQDEAEVAFKQFDKNNDNMITFIDFKKTINEHKERERSRSSQNSLRGRLTRSLSKKAGSFSQAIRGKPGSSSNRGSRGHGAARAASPSSSATARAHRKH